MIWYSLILIFSSIYVIDSLKCYTCDQQIKFDDLLLNESLSIEECTINENNISSCKGYIEIDYLTENIYIRWNSLEKQNVNDIAKLLDIPLELNQIEKNLIKFQFHMTFKPDEVFTISAMLFCQSNDFCIVEETYNLLSQLHLLKYASSKIRNEFENLLIKSSLDNQISQSTVMCFHSYSNRIVECTTTNNAACFIGISDQLSQIIAGCTRDGENLFVDVSYYMINSMLNIKNEKSSCSIHCNRDNCNTEEVYTRVINIVQKYISGTRRTYRKRSNKIV